MEPLTRVLSAQPLFARWDPPLTEALKPLCRLSLKRAGEGVFRQGEPWRGLWIPLEGRWLWEEGSGTLHPVEAGTLLGEESLLSSCETPGLLRAETRSLLLFIPRDEMISFLADHPRALSQWGGREEVAEALRKRIRLAQGVQRALPLEEGERVRGVFRPAPFLLRGGLILFLFLSLILPGLLFHHLMSGEHLSAWGSLPEVVLGGALSLGVLLLLLLAGLAFPLRYYRELMVVTDRALLFRTLRYVPFSREIQRIPLEEVEKVNQGIPSLGYRLLGLQRIQVFSAGEGPPGQIRGVPRRDNPQGIIDEARTQVETSRKNRQKMRLRELVEAGAQGLGHSAAGLAGDNPEEGREAGRWVFRKSLWVLGGKLFLPLAGAVLLFLATQALLGIPQAQGWGEPLRIIGLGAMSLWGLWRWEDWRNDQFLIESGRIIDFDALPLGFRSRRVEMSLEDVQSVRARQKGLLRNILGFGHVVIEGAAGGEPLVFEDVARPWLVQKQIFSHRRRFGQRQAAQDRRAREEELVEVLRAYAERGAADNRMEGTGREE